MFMRQQSLFVVLCVVGVFGFAVVAAEKPPENYQKAMKDLAAFNQGIDKAVMAEDYETATKLAASAQAAFGVAEQFWASRAAEAATASQTGAKAAADLAVAAGLRSQEGAAYAVKGVKAVCAPCHTAHREKMPDGTWGIK